MYHLLLFLHCLYQWHNKLRISKSIHVIFILRFVYTAEIITDCFGGLFYFLCYKARENCFFFLCYRLFGLFIHFFSMVFIQFFAYSRNIQLIGYWPQLHNKVKPFYVFLNIFFVPPVA